MSSKSRNAKMAGGAMAGAGTGAAIGSVVPGIGTAIGAGVGALGGGLAGFMADQSDEEAQENDPEYKAAKRREKSMAMMSAALGRAFAANRPATMKGAMTRGI